MTNNEESIADLALAVVQRTLGAEWTRTGYAPFVARHKRTTNKSSAETSTSATADVEAWIVVRREKAEPPGFETRGVVVSRDSLIDAVPHGAPAPPGECVSRQLFYSVRLRNSPTHCMCMLRWL